MATSTIDLHLPYDTRVDKALNNRHLQHRPRTRHRAHGGPARGRHDRCRRRASARPDAPDEGTRAAQLPELLEQLETNLTANGAHVHWAKEADDVNRTLIQIARKANVQKAVKVKSMVTEEMHLNDALAQAGITAVETDLGEFIIQLAGEPP